MHNWNKVVIRRNLSIRDTMKCIDMAASKIAFVTDDNACFMGTVSDGDIRRGILSGVPLESSVEKIMQTKPLIMTEQANSEEVLMEMKRRKIYHVPIVSREQKLVGVKTAKELKRDRQDQQVVLMLGGLGTRLAPLTNNCPKPLLKVGDKPILETIVTHLKKYGFKEFVFCVNYKAEMLEDYFGDGDQWDVNIQYIKEEKRLGTAGALKLAESALNDNFVVMNGDILTNIQFDSLMDEHFNRQSDATVCVSQYDLQVPYGTVKADNDGKFIRMDEKPTHRFFVNAGIYVLSRKCLNVIPEDTYFDMNSLLKNLDKDIYNVSVFPMREYWKDIGHLHDFEEANNDYHEVFMAPPPPML